MNIPITVGDKTYYLIGGGNSYELAEKRVQKIKDSEETKEVLVSFNWFGSLIAAFNKLLDMKVRACDAKTLVELKFAIEQARNELNAEWRLS